MNMTISVFDRYDSFDGEKLDQEFNIYLNSTEFRENPKANIFNPMRIVSSIPENNNSSLNSDINREIASYLNLRDFASFSAINVENYLTLRSDNLLVAGIIENEALALSRCWRHLHGLGWVDRPLLAMMNKTPDMPEAELCKPSGKHRVDLELAKAWGGELHTKKGAWPKAAPGNDRQDTRHAQGRAVQTPASRTSIWHW